MLQNYQYAPYASQFELMNLAEQKQYSQPSYQTNLQALNRHSTAKHQMPKKQSAKQAPKSQKKNKAVQKKRVPYGPFDDMPWYTTGDQIYETLAGWEGMPYGYGLMRDEQEDLWTGFNEGLTLPIDDNMYQMPIDQLITQKVEAIMDVPDIVTLDTPNGPIEVEMFNVPPRTEPTPVFVGDQFFDPFDDAVTRLTAPEALDQVWKKMKAAVPMMEELDVSSAVKDEREAVRDARDASVDFNKSVYDENVAVVKEKIAENIADVKEFAAEKAEAVTSALEKQKDLNKRLVEKLREAKDALAKKAEVAKELADKAKKATEKAEKSEGEMKKKLHAAASKVAQKAKEVAKEVKSAAEAHAQEVEKHVDEKINEIRRASDRHVQKEFLRAKPTKTTPKKADKKIKSMIDRDQIDELDALLEDLFDDELDFDAEIDEQLLGLDDDFIEAMIAEELLNLDQQYYMLM